MNPSIASPQKTKSELPSGIKGNKPVNETVRRALLICGILGSLLYVAMNILVPMLYPGYSSFSQTVSELSAIGAPTKQLWMVLSIPFILFEVAFGFGVLLSGGQNRSLRIAGGLLIAYGFINIFWPPMHQREVLAAGGETLTDTMHIFFGVLTSLLILLVIVFGAAAFGKRFRLYSIATILILLVFGVLAGLDAPRIAANLPTPWVGVWERINIGVYLLWVIVLAIMLLRRENKSATLTADTSVG